MSLGKIFMGSEKTQMFHEQISNIGLFLCFRDELVKDLRNKVETYTKTLGDLQTTSDKYVALWEKNVRVDGIFGQTS